jgi:hypothetical protein
MKSIGAPGQVVRLLKPWSDRMPRSAMSEVVPLDSDQRQTIGTRPTQIGTSAGLPDVRQVLLQHVLEWCGRARAQPEPLDGDALLDPEQNAPASVASGDADTRLIGGISTLKLEHSIPWSSIAFRASLLIWSRQRTETR